MYFGTNVTSFLLSMRLLKEAKCTFLPLELHLTFGKRPILAPANKHVQLHTQWVNYIVIVCWFYSWNRKSSPQWGARGFSPSCCWWTTRASAPQKSGDTHFITSTFWKHSLQIQNKTQKGLWRFDCNVDSPAGTLRRIQSIGSNKWNAIGSWEHPIAFLSMRLYVGVMNLTLTLNQS